MKYRGVFGPGFGLGRVFPAFWGIFMGRREGGRGVLFIILRRQLPVGFSVGVAGGREGGGRGFFCGGGGRG